MGILSVMRNELPAQVAVNNDGSLPAASSMLDIKSTSKGLLAPRMTASQRDNISSPATGLLVFVNDDNTFYFYSGTVWIPVLSAMKTDGDWTIAGNNLFSAVSGNVGIGTTNPTTQLELTQSLRIPATTSNITGIIFKGSVPFLHDYKGPIALGFNTFLGQDAGNFTSGGGSDYLGCNNTGIGFNVLRSVTTGYANTGIGAFTLPANTTGYENTAVGVLTMNANTTGTKNTAIGYMANFYNQTGSYNTIVGFEAGKGSSGLSKSGNVFLGYQAGYSETGNNKLYIENSSSAIPLIGGDFSANEVYINGKLRIADGTQSAGRILAAASNGTASWVEPTTINTGDWTVSGNNIYSAVAGNVGIGITNPGQQLEITQSLKMPATTSSSTGVVYKGDVPFIHDYKGAAALGFNTFIGQGAGNFISGGSGNWEGCNNTGSGYFALHGISSGYANTATGAFALQSNTTGVENTAVGLQAMTTNTSGGKNTAIGYMAMMQNTSGHQNTAIGFNANYNNQTGSYNTIIGYEAGKGGAAHSKSGNVFIGYQAGYSETGSNKLYIDNSNTTAPLIGGDFSTNEVAVNGKLGVGVTSPNASSVVEISSTTKGFLPPRLTSAQIAAISSPAAGLMVYNTTFNKPNYFNGTNWLNFDGSVAFPQVGTYYEGGIVVYVDGTGQHGLIATQTDQLYNYWGCIGTLIGASGTALYTGDDNTALIVTCGDSHAAHKCDTLQLNGKTDWYLPAIDELTEIYNQRAYLGTFQSYYYWSSTEIDAGTSRALIFPGGSQNTLSKNYNGYVRCMRQF